MNEPTPLNAVTADDLSLDRIAAREGDDGDDPLAALLLAAARQSDAPLRSPQPGGRNLRPRRTLTALAALALAASGVGVAAAGEEQPPAPIPSAETTVQSPSVGAPRNLVEALPDGAHPDARGERSRTAPALALPARGPSTRTKASSSPHVVVSSSIVVVARTPVVSPGVTPKGPPAPVWPPGASAVPDARDDRTPVQDPTLEGAEDPALEGAEDPARDGAEDPARDGAKDVVQEAASDRASNQALAPAQPRTDRAADAAPAAAARASAQAARQSAEPEPVHQADRAASSGDGSARAKEAAQAEPAGATTAASPAHP